MGGIKKEVRETRRVFMLTPEDGHEGLCGMLVETS